MFVFDNYNQCWGKSLFKKSKALQYYVAQLIVMKNNALVLLSNFMPAATGVVNKWENKSNMRYLFEKSYSHIFLKMEK